MNLSTKIIAAASVAVLATAAGTTTTVYWLSARNRVDALHQQMNVVLRQAETVAERMDAMHRNKSFDFAGMLAAARAQGGDRPIAEFYRETAFYNTIPIVAAWQAGRVSPADALRT